MTERQVDGTTRRVVLLGAGAVGAAGLMAACGADEPSGAASTNAPAVASGPGGETTTGGAPTTGSGIKVADIPVGGGMYFPDGHFIVTQPTAGDIKAFDATCTHMACTVSAISGGLMTCECHGSQFRIADGSVARGPNTGQPLTRGLAPLNVTVTGDTVTVS